MADNFLSQAEIDALLNQGSQSSAPEISKAAKSVVAKVQEVLGQFINESVSSSDLHPEEGGLTKLIPALSGLVVAVVNFSPGGKCLLALDEELAGKIAATVMGQDPSDVTGIDETGLSVFGEAFSQIAGGISTAAAQSSGQKVTFDPPVPEVYDGDQSLLADLFDSGEVGVYKTELEVNDFEAAEFWVLLNESFESYWSSGASEAAASSGAAAIPKTDSPQTQGRPFSSPGIENPPRAASDGGSMSNSLPNGVNVKKAVFSPLEQMDSGQMQNINLLLDVPLEITVELGRTKMQIKEILELGKGSLIELSKLAGEPVDIVVNGKLLAKGEVVVIDETFGVKIVDIVSPMERVNTLQ